MKKESGFISIRPRRNSISNTGPSELERAANLGRAASPLSIGVTIGVSAAQLLDNDGVGLRGLLSITSVTNAVGGSAESFQSNVEGISRSALVQFWEVQTAKLQTDAGEPKAGITKEEYKGRAGQLAAPLASLPSSTQAFWPVMLDLAGDGFLVMEHNWNDQIDSDRYPYLCFDASSTFDCYKKQSCSRNEDERCRPISFAKMQRQSANDVIWKKAA